MGTVRGNETEMIDAFKNGESVASIARRHEVPTTSVSRVLAKAGLRKMTTVLKLDEATEAQIVEKYQAGIRTFTIASQYGIAVTTVRKIVRKHGGEVHPRGQRYREFTDEEIKEMARRWDSGESQHSIGQAFGGIGQAIVSRILRGAGYAPEPRRPTGDRHGSWKGGRIKHPSGYWQVMADRSSPFFVMANRAGYVLEHRLIMAESLGRPLTSRETVHHINGNRTDNRLENLQLRAGHHGHGVVRRCGDCGSHNIIEQSLADAKDKD